MSIMAAPIKRRVKRRLEYEDKEGDAGYMDGEYRRFKISSGRNLTNNQVISRLNRGAVGYTIERFGGMNRLYGGHGYYVLDHRESSVNVGPPSIKLYDCPHYMFELTQRTPYSDRVYASTKMGYRMQTYNVIDLVTPSNTKTDVLFTGVKGLTYNSDNATAATETDYAQILVNNTDNLASGDITASRAACGLLEWSKVKILLRSPIARAGKFIIRVLKFTDPLFPPTTSYSEDRDAFYERDMSEYMYNPIKTQEYGASRKRREYVTVVKSFVKEFSPSVNAGFVNSQIHGQTFEVDMFLRLNKFVNFAQRVGPDFAGGQEYLNDDTLIVDTNTHRVYNHPHQVGERLFLSVMMSYYDEPRSLNSEFDAETDGSFDLEVHNKYVWKGVGV